jgi:hypothetical protein
MSVSAGGEVRSVSLAKSILSISFLKVPREWLVIRQKEREVPDQEPLRSGAEFSVMLRQSDRTEYKVVGCGFSCTLGFGIFDTVAQAAAAIGRTLDVEVQRLSYLGAAMDADRPLSYYRIRPHIGVVRFTGRGRGLAARGPVLINQVVEFKGEQSLVKMDEELEYGKLKNKLAAKFHVAPHEVALMSAAGEIRDWETPKSAGRPPTINIVVRSSRATLPVAPPAQAVLGTEYQFCGRDGRPIATLRYDANDTFAAACQKISALMHWPRVKCFVRTSSGFSQIDEEMTFDELSDLLEESGNTLIAEEWR